MESSLMSVQDKQKASLDALLCLDAFCEKHGLVYYLTYGTLIGAIRHHGFIPWDDDVDVMIPRPDYETLLREFRDPTGTYELHSCFSHSDYVLPYAKLQNMRTQRVLSDGTALAEGIGVDLFPLDGIQGDLETAREQFRKKNDKFRRIIQRYDRFRYMRGGGAGNLLKRLSGSLLFSSGYLRKIGQEISANPFGSDYHQCSRFCPAVGIHSGKFRVLEKEWLDPVRADFEGYRLLVPSGYDAFLTMVYGDYMQVPPEDQRESTHDALFVWRK